MIQNNNNKEQYLKVLKEKGNLIFFRLRELTEKLENFIEEQQEKNVSNDSSNTVEEIQQKVAGFTNVYQLISKIWSQTDIEEKYNIYCLITSADRDTLDFDNDLKQIAETLLPCAQEFSQNHCRFVM